MVPVQNFEIIEIQTIAGIARYKIPSQTNFRNRKIKAIEAWSVSEVSKSPQNATVLNATAFKAAYFTLCVGGREKIKDIPLPALCDPNYYKTKFETNGLIIDADKSYVEIPDVSLISPGEVILLGFYFDE